MSSRGISLILICGGAAASIATSAPASDGWELFEREDLESAILDTQHPVARYRIHAELHGPEPFDGLSGVIRAFVVDTLPNTSPGASATISLRSLTHPELGPSVITASANVSSAQDVSIESWLSCVDDPCAEDFELTMTLDPEPAASTFGTSSFVTALAQGNAKTLPEGTVLTITGEKVPANTSD